VLLAVPNVSEGRDERVLDAIGTAFSTEGARVLDVHADPDHHRAVFTLAAEPGVLASAVLAGAREAVARIDISAHPGAHPHVGALDVAPIVYLDPPARGAAAAEALVLADLIGEELHVPVLLYGALAGGRTRAQLRKGGPHELARRLQTNDLTPDFGPNTTHPTAGATLVAARPPLIAFNLELAAPATEQDAKRIAAAVREGGPEGLTGVRAIGLKLSARNHVAQVSLNVEDHRATPLHAVVEAVQKHAPVSEAELVGLAPASALEGVNVHVRNRRTIEDVLAANQ
jgi:glutamate formiminotransferase / 5-formyltetrahydrofolate cyclo-ligase